MNKEDIIRMAREVGGVDLQSHGWTTWVGTQSTEFLERFAALVASAAQAKEREAILAVIGDNQCECRCSEVVRDRGQA